MRGWYLGWIGGILSLVFGAGLATVALVLAVRNYFGTPNEALFQLASVMALTGIAFIVLGFAIRQSCAGCCDWEECYAPNTELRTRSSQV